MKKILLFSMAILFGVMLNAQSFKGGIMAGLAASQVDGDMYAGYHRAGLIAGVFVNHDLSEKFLWQLEIKYIQKGSFKNENPDAFDYSIYSLRLNYFELPLLIRFKYKEHFSFDAGLSLGYLAAYREADQIGELPYDATRPDFHKVEFASQMGGSYHFNKNFSLNARYSYSILQVRDHVGGGVHWTNRGQYNNVLQFSLYYCINNKEE
jgi:hypothetical protein